MGQLFLPNTSISSKFLSTFNHPALSVYVCYHAHEEFYPCGWPLKQAAVIVARHFDDKMVHFRPWILCFSPGWLQYSYPIRPLLTASRKSEIQPIILLWNLYFRTLGIEALDIQMMNLFPSKKWREWHIFEQFATSGMFVAACRLGQNGGRGIVLDTNKAEEKVKKGMKKMISCFHLLLTRIFLWKS